MPVTHKSLAEIEEHWAVQSLDPAARAKVFSDAATRVFSSAVGEQFEINEQTAEARGFDATDAARRLATAYELAAVDTFSSLLSDYEADAEGRNRSQAAASQAYELLRTLPLPEDAVERIFHVLHVAALAYCSDRWTELRGWLRDQGDNLFPPRPEMQSWELRIVWSVYDCWIRLLRKKDWRDLEEIAAIVTALREQQAEFEPSALNADINARPAIALRLVSMYHWARATELLGTHVLQGEPAGIAVELDRHFEAANAAASAANDASLDVLFRWLHVAARQMVSNSIWRVAAGVEGPVAEFLRDGATSRGMFEFMPPQRVAVAEQGLLDPAHRAVVIDLPTSGGKTMLAELRILQAINAFRERGGWVAYVAPTRALVNQLSRRLRRDFGPIGVRVEQLTSAVDLDSFESSLLDEVQTGDGTPFDVLVLTPEKLDLIVRGKRTDRPLSLLVLDEAHNIEDESRGLRIELLLANVQRDQAEARFLLMMPHVDNADDLAKWLGADQGKSVQLGTTSWQPNDRVVGMFWPESEPGSGNWAMRFQSLVTSPGTLVVDGAIRVGPVRPLAPPMSRMSGLGMQAAAMSRIMSDRGTSIALARTLPDCWRMARSTAAALDAKESESIALVQRFLADEISADFELIELLSKGVAVHHSGLSDDARTLIEWLAEIGDLRVLCATTGIAQGINFPVSSVFLGSRQLPVRGSREMSTRAFWNLAGRAGRVDQDPVGIVGLARGNDADAVMRYVSSATEALVSRLATLLREVDEAGQLADLSGIIRGQQWDDFRGYVAHLWNEHRNLEAVLAGSESLLRNTFGFSRLRASGDEDDKRRADALLAATQTYATELAEHPENSALTDTTGFAPEGVRTAILEMRKLDEELTGDSWSPENIFGNQAGSALPALIGVMLKIPQLSNLDELSDTGLDRERIARLSQAWVSGESIDAIARRYFADQPDLTSSISKACQAIYRTIGYSASWGLSALSQMPGSGVNFEELTPEQKRSINNLPAMLYHGVSTEQAVLMRMNSAPRSVAEKLGIRFQAETAGMTDVEQWSRSRTFLRSLSDDDWSEVRPEGSTMAGADYSAIWRQLAGERI